MPQIIPIKELKDTAKISDMCHASNEPIFVTKNGYGDMVFMSMETYEQNMRLQTIYRELDISERQVAEGKVKDAKSSLDSLRKKYDI